MDVKNTKVNTMRQQPLIRSPYSHFLLMLAVFLTASGTLAATATGTPEAFYERALKLLDKDDHRGAIIELKNSLQADPGDLTTRILLGRTYLKVEDGASAAKELNLARRHGAQDKFVLVLLGRAYVMQGLYANALKILRTAGHDDKTAAEIGVVRGDAYLALRDFDNATQSYAEALQKQPNDAKALIGMARVEIGLGKLDAAGQHAQSAVDINPNDAEGWYVQGEIARLGRQPAEALKFYDRAIELAPKFSRALMARAGINTDLGHSGKAEADIARILELQPNNPEALYLNALALARRGEIKAAQEKLVEAENILHGYPTRYIEANPPVLLLAGVVSYFRKNFETAYRHLSLYLKKVPRHLGARKLLASIALKRGETENAIELLAGVAPHLPKDVEIQTMYGDALMRAGRYEEATAVFEKASAIAEPGSPALSKLLILQLVGGQGNEAIRKLESEVKRDPADVKTALLLIGAQIRSGDYKTALSTTNQVLKNHPDNPVVHNLAGGVHLGVKNIDGARQSFNKALELAPDYLPALFNLAKLETRVANADSARGHYMMILDKDPQNGKAMFALAEIDRRRNDMDGAFRWLEKARSSSRNSNLASLLLIDLYLQAQRTDDAVLTATKLQKADPGNLTFFTALGRAQLGAKKLEKAGDTFREVAKRAAEQKSPFWLHESAKWLLRVRDVKSARRALETAITANKEYLPAHLELFKLDLAANDFEGAKSRANDVAALNPDSPAGDTLKGDLHTRLGEIAEAERAYLTAFNKKPSTPLALRVYRTQRAAGKDGFRFVANWAEKHQGDPAAQRLLATAFAEAGRPHDALKIYEKLIKSAPNDAALLNNLALLYEPLGDKRALEYARRAYQSAPGQPGLMDTYGWILVRSGETAKGLRLLRNAHLRLPKVPEIRYHIAVALNALGKHQEAARELRAALASGEKFIGDKEARGLLEKLSSSKR